MGSIVLLDELTINKIAAGEVVNRPASIVKELIENSIDAKATSITIEIKNGGIKYIKIVDNGTGFASDDIELAFERHATSKIRKEEDLLKITSMGFRGEALASVAAVSKVTLTTKNINEDIGNVVQVEAGNIISKMETASVTGTKIEIRDVFYNVPARFKFLKKDSTEAGYIEDVVIRASLSNPSVSFKYINNSKTIIQTNGNGNLKDTIYDIFGKEIYQNLLELDYELNNVKVNGVIGLPQVSRSTRMHQFTFINSRHVKDKTINSAIDRACEQKYAINKFPFIVMNLGINPSHIDVNVHPAKLEVKFEEETKVFDAIYYAIKKALETHEINTSPFTNIKSVQNVDKIEQISKDLLNNGVIKTNAISDRKFDFGEVKTTLTKDSKEQIEKSEETNINETTNNQEVENLNDSLAYNTNLDSGVDNNVASNAANNLEKIREKALEENENLNFSISETVPKEDLYNFSASEEKKEFETYTENIELADIESTEKQKESVVYKYIGQVFDTYIIIQIKDTMYIIDQHAAHERLLYEQIKSAYYSKDKQTQLLLIPVLVELTTKEMDIVINNMEMFEKSGFMLEEFGDNTIKISGVPNIGYDIEYKSMFKDIIDEMLGANKTEKSEKEFRFLATLACKAAVKGRMKLDRQEQIALIEEMVKLDNPFTCPHGRPTAYEITKYEIERRFLRK